MTRSVLAAVIVGTLAPVMFAWAAAPTIVSQIHRAFSIHELSLKRGDVVRFSNADEFIHHIYVSDASFAFNSGEQPPGRDVDVVFPVAGTFQVRCEVHPKMLLKVSVQ